MDGNVTVTSGSEMYIYYPAAPGGADQGYRKSDVLLDTVYINRDNHVSVAQLPAC